MSYRISERRACRVTRLHRGTYRYSSQKNPWTALRMKIREIAQARVRYGYRKIRVLLNREGWGVGKSLMQRLYREEGLGLKQRPKRRRRAAEHPRERVRATEANQAWSLDFVADQLTDGRRFRALTIVEPSTGLCEPNAWTHIGSRRSWKRRRALRLGGRNTMRAVLTGLSGRGRRTNSPMRLRLAATSLGYKQPKTHPRVGTKNQVRSAAAPYAVSLAQEYQAGLTFFMSLQIPAPAIWCSHLN